MGAAPTASTSRGITRGGRSSSSVASAEAANAGRAFIRTVWTHFDEALLDPEHPQRVAMRVAAIDRLVLAVLGRPMLVTQRVA